MSILNGFNTESLGVRRFAAGTRTKGRYTRGTQSSINIDAVAMPINGKERLLLPEGERNREIIKIYSESEFFTADELNNKSADIVTWKGKEYEIINVSDWNNSNFPDLSHYRCLAAKLEVDVDKRPQT